MPTWQSPLVEVVEVDGVAVEDVPVDGSGASVAGFPLSMSEQPALLQPTTQ